MNLRKAALFLALFSTAVVAQPLAPPGIPPDLVLPGPSAAGRFYGPAITIVPSAVAVGLANRLHAAPVYIRQGSLLKTLSFNITTGNSSAWNARMCLYADTGAGLPGALVTDPGTVAVGSGSITGVQTATVAGGGVAVGGKWYWVTFMADNNGESISQMGNASVGPLSSSRLLGWASAANAAAGTTATGVYAAQTFGACPGTFPTATYADSVAIPYVIMGY